MENGPFIDGLPIKNSGFFHGYVANNQRVYRWLSNPPWQWSPSGLHWQNASDLIS
jgi:hypothetical protein